MSGEVWVDPTNYANKVYIMSGKGVTPPSGYVLQSGSDGSIDRAMQTYEPYGSGGFPVSGDVSTRGTFTGAIR